MPTRTINYLAWVHTLPADLRKPLPVEREHLEETSELYQFVIDSRLLWKIWKIDEYHLLWIEVSRMSLSRKPEFHTVRIDEGTFDRIDCEPYTTEDESTGKKV